PLRVASPVRELVSVAVIPAVPPAGQPASERLNAFDAKLLVAEPFAVWVDELADVEHARVIRTRRAVDPDDGVKHLPLAVRERSRRRTFRAEPHELDARPPRLRLERTVFVDALEHRPHEWARHFVGLALFDVVGSHLSLVRWRLVSTGLRPQERRQIDVERTPRTLVPGDAPVAVVHELERARRSAHAAIARRGFDIEHVHEIAVVLDEIRRDRADRAEIALLMR